jgi:hypothetical protein
MYRVEAPSERAYSDAYATALAIAKAHRCEHAWIRSDHDGSLVQVMADGRVLQSLPTTTED